jgi:hypothetical protein
LKKLDVPAAEFFLRSSTPFNSMTILEKGGNTVVITVRKEVAILLGKLTNHIKMVSEEVGENKKANECLLRHSHKMHHGVTMEIGSSLKTEF